MQDTTYNPRMSNKARGRAEGKQNPLTPARFCQYRPHFSDSVVDDAGEVNFFPEPCYMWPKPADCKNCPHEGMRLEVTEFNWGGDHPGGGTRNVQAGRDVLVIFFDAAGKWRKREFFRLPMVKENPYSSIPQKQVVVTKFRMSRLDF